MFSNFVKSLKQGMMASTSSTSSPARLSKKDRARFAKETVNKVIPNILKSNPRARLGIKDAELIRYAPEPKAPGQRAAVASEPPSSAIPTETVTSESSKQTEQPSPPNSTSPRIRIIQSDTYDAVQTIIKSTPDARVAALNMASELRPGGGVLNGAVAQEESLCMRSTLFHSRHLLTRRPCVPHLRPA